MRITMNGDLVEIDQKHKIVSKLKIDNQTIVQYKQDKLIINGAQIENFDKLFINRLDYAIKNFEIRLQQAIQQFICNRQEVLKINQTDRKLVTRYIWISDNYSELRYSDAPLSKSYKKIPFHEIQFQYQQLEPKIMKSIKKYDLYPEYILTLNHKKKQLQLVFLSFRKLNSFIMICNWILRQKELQEIKFSALEFLKCKLIYSAQNSGLTLKKYLIIQLNRIRTQYTLRTLSNNQSIQESSSSKKKWSVQLTIKKQENENKENVVKKIQFS